MEISFVKKDPLQDLLSSLNAVISTNESTEIITGHVIYNPAYTSFKFKLKTTIMSELGNTKDQSKTLPSLKHVTSILTGTYLQLPLQCNVYLLVLSR